MFHGQCGERFVMLALHKTAILIVSVLLVYEYYLTAPIVVRVKDPKFSLRGPYNASESKVDDVYDQLIDLKNFSFLINPDSCKSHPAGLLLVIIIASNPSNDENRMVIRNTWGRSVDSTKIVFLMGNTENTTVLRKIQNESIMYNDIVQGSFSDSYRNMTYKHVMGLKWVSHHCPMAKYVLKTDDDVLVNTRELRRFLARELSPWGAKDLITCQVLEHARAQRSQRSKWMVSTAEYALSYYPTYCAGWAILYSQDVVPRLLRKAQLTPYFWIDDVHITGVIAEKLGIARTPLTSLVLSRSRVKILTTLGPGYTGPFLFGPPDLAVSKISQIWKAIPE